MYVHASVSECVHKCVCKCTYVLAHVKNKAMLSIFLSHFAPFPRQGLSLYPEHTDLTTLAASWAPGVFLSLPPQHCHYRCLIPVGIQICITMLIQNTFHYLRFPLALSIRFKLLKCCILKLSSEFLVIFLAKFSCWDWDIAKTDTGIGNLPCLKF